MAELYPPTKMVAKYKCPECGSKWKSINSLGGSKQCIKCKGEFLKPYKTRPTKEKDLKPKRKFAKYYCSCGNNWASGNAWVGKWQECRDCGEKVMPQDMRPLRPSRNFTVQKPHETSLCQQCIELGPGRNCREYVPTAADAADIPDDQSIISEASTSSSSSWAEEQALSDDERTPVGSENEEEIDDFLDSKMKSLKLKD